MTETLLEASMGKRVTRRNNAGTRGLQRRPATRRNIDPPEMDRAAEAKRLAELLNCPPWFAERAASEEFDEYPSPEEQAIAQGLGWILRLVGILEHGLKDNHERELLKRADRALRTVPLANSAGISLKGLSTFLTSHLSLRHALLEAQIRAEEDDRQSTRCVPSVYWEPFFEIAERTRRLEEYAAAIGRAMESRAPKTLVERRKDELDVAFHVQMGRRLLSEACDQIAREFPGQPTLDDVTRVLWGGFQAYLRTTQGVTIENASSMPLVDALAAKLTTAIAKCGIGRADGRDRKRLPFLELAIEATADLLNLTTETVRQRNKRAGTILLDGQISLVPQP